MRLRTSLSLVSALALAACAVGPDHVPPALPQAASGPFLSTEPGVTSVAPADADWWRLYRDPVLDGLVADALRANTDVRVAVARIGRARALLREVRAERLPQAGLGAGADYARVPESAAGGGDRQHWSFDAGLEIAYEVDLFGRAGRTVEAAAGDLAAARADADAVRVATVAETTRAYADAVSAAARQAVAERIVALLDRSLDLTERRRGVGLATRLDTARIASLRDQRRAEVPALVAERKAALFRLATLTGRAPAELPAEAEGRRTGLALQQAIPVGDGAALLSRRPDVQAAERRLAAATARIGVATADLYPRITLGGAIGSTGASLGEMLSGGPFRWLLGGLLDWSVNRGPARARIAAAEADSQAALATFDGAVLRALEETETALVSYARTIERRAALESSRREAEVAARIMRARQAEGDIDSLALLDAERTFADAEASVAAADADIVRAQIDLFRALGGSWPRSAAAGAG